jgi:hypothetical protein
VKEPPHSGDDGITSMAAALYFTKDAPRHR